MSQQTDTVPRESATSEETPAAADAGELLSSAGAQEEGNRRLYAADPTALDRLGSIEVQATVEVGTAELLVRDLAALAPGYVVQLDRMVGEPADLKVNGHLFARGEVVVLDDQLGLRITELIGGERSEKP